MSSERADRRDSLRGGRRHGGGNRSISEIPAQIRLLESVEGAGKWTIDAFLWGNWKGDERIGDHSIPRPKELGVVHKLRRTRHLSAEEFVYLRRRTSRIPNDSRKQRQPSGQVDRRPIPPTEGDHRWRAHTR